MRGLVNGLKKGKCNFRISSGIQRNVTITLDYDYEYASTTINPFFPYWNTVVRQTCQSTYCENND